MYKIATKTKQGKAHAKKGINCQDKVAFNVNEDIVAVALSDGAGSKADSGLLADAITKGLSKFVAKEFDFLYKNESMKDILYNKIISIVNSYSNKGYDVACTLLMVAIKDNYYIAVHIGDGIIIGVNHGGASVISRPENGNNINETAMCEPLMDDSNIRIYEGICEYDTIIMTSDGIEPNLWNKNTGEIAEAVPMMRKWMIECSSIQVEYLMEDAINNVFGMNTNDDMSLLIIQK